MSKLNGHKSKARNVFIAILAIGVFLYYFLDITPQYIYKYIIYLTDKNKQTLNETNYGTDSDGEEVMNQLRANLPEKNSHSQSQVDNTIKSPVMKTNIGTEVHLQEVKNLGYTFSLGEIDSTGATSITDDLKNQITSIVYTSKFPANLLKETPIIILNSLALTGDQYISVPAGKLEIPDLKPDFLSEGGIYLTYNNGSAVVVINKTTLLKGEFNEVLTHELGHAVGSKLTEQEWVEFYKLRNIPAGQPRRGTNWSTSPLEDFAEVYKNIFTNKEIHTYFGQLIPASVAQVMYGDIERGKCSSVSKDALARYDIKPEIAGDDPDMMSKAFDYGLHGGIASSTIRAKINADEAVQTCRSEVMLNPSKYPSEWSYGVPYKSSVNQVTKNFISSIINRLK